MSLSSPVDPHTGAPLQLTTVGGVSRWVSTSGTGEAVTLAQLHDNLQDDEIETLWQAAKVKYQAGETSPLSSPTGDRKMVRVVVSVDADELSDAATDATTVTVDVDFDDQIIWFDTGELEQFPADIANPEDREWTPEEDAAIRRSAQEMADAWAMRVRSEQSIEALDPTDLRKIEGRIAALLSRSSTITSIANKIFGK
jgi:hypothetical protein